MCNTSNLGNEHHGHAQLSLTTCLHCGQSQGIKFPHLRRKGQPGNLHHPELFMIMGFSVPFYNAFLTLYYMGVIKYNMSDDTLAKYELPAYLISILWPLIVRIFAISVNLFIHEFIWSVPDMAINVPLLKMRRIVYPHHNCIIFCLRRRLVDWF